MYEGNCRAAEIQPPRSAKLVAVDGTTSPRRGSMYEVTNIVLFIQII